jgi:four helix bundle protein
VTKYTDPPGFDVWEAQVPLVLRNDPIWRTPAYRYGLWISDLAAADVAPLFKHIETQELADQLLRAAQSISSNLSEGYGRTTGPERARYYDYAVSSTRESIDWYYKARQHLGDEVLAQRHELLLRIIRILSAVIPRERADRIGRARRTRTRRSSDQQ